MKHTLGGNRIYLLSESLVAQHIIGRGRSFDIGYDKYSTSKRGVFVGYDEHRRAYRILPDGARSFVVSRNVVFDERSIVQRMLTDCTTEQSEQETIFEPNSNVFISNSNTDRQHVDQAMTTTEATHGYDQHSSPMHEIHPA